MASQFVANLIRLKQEGFKPDRDLILALTADEEGGNFNGVDWLVKNHRDLIDAEFAINEGGGGSMREREVPHQRGAGQREGVPGFPPRGDEPGRPQLAAGQGQRHLPPRRTGSRGSATFDFPVQMNEVTRGYFERSAAVQTDPKMAADMRAVAGPTPDPAAARGCRRGSSYYNALMRTTCVATRLSGGHAHERAAADGDRERQLPHPARRIAGIGPADELVEVLADPQIAVAFVDEAKPSKPSPLTPDVMQPIESITKAMWPGVIVVPVMSTGATDGLYLRNAGIPTYGVDGMFGELDDVRSHGKDERVGVKQYFESVEYLYRLMKSLSSTGKAATQ